MSLVPCRHARAIPDVMPWLRLLRETGEPPGAAVKIARQCGRFEPSACQAGSDAVTTSACTSATAGLAAAMTMMLTFTLASNRAPADNSRAPRWRSVMPYHQSISGKLPAVVKDAWRNSGVGYA